jgi:hypothetical protein
MFLQYPSPHIFSAPYIKRCYCRSHLMSSRVRYAAVTDCTKLVKGIMLWYSPMATKMGEQRSTGSKSEDGRGCQPESVDHISLSFLKEQMDSNCTDRVIVHAARIPSPARSCGICGEQSNIRAGVLRVLRFTKPIFIQPTALYSFIILSTHAIQGVPLRKISILGGHSIGHS